MGAIELVLAIVMVAVVTEAVMEVFDDLLKLLPNKNIRTIIRRFIGLFVGITLAFTLQLDITYIIDPTVTTQGMLVTGVLCSKGADFIVKVTKDMMKKRE